MNNKEWDESEPILIGDLVEKVVEETIEKYYHRYPDRRLGDGGSK